MNARVDWQEQGEADDTTEAFRCAVRQVVSSPAFAKAPRMCNLLSFLAEKKLGGEGAGLTEYVIGMQLFRRDPAAYDTAIDPVVRVQMGRLRTKLADYYGAMNDPGAPQICIPAGSYVPDLPRGAPATGQLARLRVALASLRCLSPEQRGSVFAGGVDEELCVRLFVRCPALMQVRGGGSADAPLRLEGSIRIEQRQVRVTMRLVDHSDGHTLWSAQIDGSGVLGIALQEQLANAMCDQVVDHFKAAGHAL